MLHKHSQRTNRQPCKRCGAEGLYWAHDDEQYDRRGTSATHPCRDCGHWGAWVLIERSGERHECPQAAKAGGWTHPDDDAYVQEVRALVEPEVREAERVERYAVAMHEAEVPASADPLANALDMLRVALSRPAIDRDQVEAIVREAVAGIVTPTRTVVVTNGEPREVEGLTHHALADVVMLLSTGFPVLMVGPAGTGKSTIARQASEALGIEGFGEVSLDPQMSSSALFGYMHAGGEYVSTVFRKVWEFGGVFHFDEFDNGHPSILAKLNAALALGPGCPLAFPDGMVPRHPEFRAIASANTFGTGPDRVYVGRQQLDAATLDRFLVWEVDYDEALEANACDATGVAPNIRDHILGVIRDLRARNRDHKLTRIFGQRSSIYACTLAARGASPEMVLAATIRRGTTDVDWSRLGEPTLAWA